MPRLRPPLFPFESQAVLGLVCVLCKCRVGGERLISGIAGCVGGGCQGGAVLWIGWLGGGRSERPLSARGGRCRSQVKVRRPRLPARPCSPSEPGCFVLPCWGPFLLRVSSRASGLWFLAHPGETISKQIPCRALRRGKREGYSSRKTAILWLIAAFSLGMLNRLTSVSGQLRVQALLTWEPDQEAVTLPPWHWRRLFGLSCSAQCVRCVSASAVVIPSKSLSWGAKFEMSRKRFSACGV